ncbi:hypothetical protein E4T66_13690 [Sinimarinibacterium sp. CAU 1509]|uniref:fatty acid desaturase family protein n=1 Tax=Sinimarinibacterium sp. CAU 1509 TaxID=2562283 RepID=UPI0010AC44A3|nr:fatty acid desaturase [Sinimarinibacterium sp. CAU 1509]TJY59436.1 hypothetical protein E4T66_13690 [Sinimarinibacterium sp. CAU 1509]
MTEDLGKPLSIPESKRAEFKRLTSAPTLSIPVVGVVAGGTTAAVGLIVAAVTQTIPFWLAATLLAFIYYWFFSAVHDSIHGAVAKNRRLNDALGQLVITLVVPYANLGLMRWAHMEHHRFTNDGTKDPDSWSHGAWYSLPFRWLLIDVMYTLRLIRSDAPIVKKVIRELIPYLALGAAVIGGLISAGYGAEYFWLSFLPSRLMFLGIGFTFFWLPHNHWNKDKMDLRQSDNFTRATSVREGREWLMNLLLQYQNYHLVHHMWPMTPFYNNERVFRLLEPEFRKRDLVLVKSFEVFPKIESPVRPGNKMAA